MTRLPTPAPGKSYDVLFDFTTALGFVLRSTVRLKGGVIDCYPGDGQTQWARMVWNAASVGPGIWSADGRDYAVPGPGCLLRVVEVTEVRE